MYLRFPYMYYIQFVLSFWFHVRPWLVVYEPNTEAYVHWNITDYIPTTSRYLGITTSPVEINTFSHIPMFALAQNI